MSNATVSPILSVSGLDLTVSSLNILKDINLSVLEKEFVCIVGASGCGKTTLLRLMGGLLTPRKAHVKYRGREVSGPDRELAVVFQDYSKALLPWRTVAVNNLYQEFSGDTSPPDAIMRSG